MKSKKRNSISVLLKWAGKDKYYIYLSVICSFISGILTMVPYYTIYKIMEKVYANKVDKTEFIKYLVILVIAIIFRFVLFSTSGVLSHKGAYNTLFKVRCMVVEHMAKVPLGNLSEQNTGDIKTVLNEEIEKLELFLAHHLPELVFYMTGPVVIFVYLSSVNFILSLISLIPLVIAFGVMAIMFKGTDKMMDRATKSIANLNSSIIEYISGMRIIKAYNMGSQSFNKFSNSVDDEYAVWKEMSLKMGPPYAAYVVIIECGLLLMVPIGGMWFLNGSVTQSAFILFAFVGSLYLTEIRPLQELGSKFAQVLNSVNLLKDILDIKAFEGGSEFPKKHSIEMKNVTFSYDNKTNILKNVNFKINQGEKIAIVGHSGAGKSTIIQLVSRFYDTNEGEILIGGKNVKEINYETLLEQVSIVFQKTFLTRGTIYENIAMGMNTSIEEVRKAAQKAQIDDFIMRLPEGYNTLVKSYGSRFSGGQKQRIAIARAILKNSPILILDEATSSADPENQVEIDKAINNLCEGKTVIIVAHRLGVVRQCDKVAVVENNTVSIFDTHEEVLRNNKYYKKAWKDYEEARGISYNLRTGKEVL
ncbi:ABC transporter ATP-binding protein [Clostridium sporogenes]|nr:ABC transporter ATP-binding protein [Clostridium sporogenes]NFS25362.1 ABC transporter ATP-binding protein [Clostridium sporogenes]